MEAPVQERVLVNFFYAQPVGHAVEALHYAHGHHAADPARELSVALNAATATELADLCPFVAHAYAVDHPFLEPCEDSTRRLAGLPREWDWVLDDPRRHQDFQLAAFAGMRDYYAASVEHLVAREGRTIAGPGRLSYLPHQPLRFDLEPAPLEGQTIAVMLAGSSEPALYPSLESWRSILDAFRSIIPDVDRFPCFSQFVPPEITGGRTPSMSDERFNADLDRIVAAAGELLRSELTYERALREYFADLASVTSDIWSIDGVHLMHVK